MDLWQFTPLHEAASKNRLEVCSLLLAHGADPTLVNCHSKNTLDVSPTSDVADRINCMLCITLYHIQYLYNAAYLSTTHDS